MGSEMCIRDSFKENHAEETEKSDVAGQFPTAQLWIDYPCCAPEDVLVVQIAEPKSMDPATVTVINVFRILMNVYDGLVRYRSGTLDVDPGLAESWTISDHGKVYTF